MRAEVALYPASVRGYFYCANLIANLSLQSDAFTYSLGLYLHIYPNKHFPFVRKPASPQRISRSGLDMS